MPLILSPLGDSLQRVTAKGDLSLESDIDVSGTGDLIFKTSGVERARITAAGAWDFAGSLAATAKITATTYAAAAGELVLASVFLNSLAITLPSAPLPGTRVGVTLVQSEATPSARSVSIACGGTDVFDTPGSGKTTYNNALTLLGETIIFRYTAGGAWAVESGSPTRGISAKGDLFYHANAGNGSSQGHRFFDGSAQLAKIVNVNNDPANWAGGLQMFGKNGSWQLGVDQGSSTPLRDWFLLPTDGAGAPLRSDFLYATYPADPTTRVINTLGPTTLNVGFRDDGSTTAAENRNAALAVWGDGRNLAQEIMRLVYRAGQTGNVITLTNVADDARRFQVDVNGRILLGNGSYPFLPGMATNTAWQSGRYYAIPPSFSTGTVAMGRQSMRASRFTVPNAVTLTKIGLEVTGAGGASAVVRIGIYADDGTGRPGTLLLDCGTIDGTSATVQEKTISLALNPGDYYVATMAEGSASAPTVRASGNIGVSFIDLGTSIPASGLTGGNWRKDSVAEGGFPGTFSATAAQDNTNWTRVFVKAA